MYDDEKYLKIQNEVFEKYNKLEVIRNNIICDVVSCGGIIEHTKSYRLFPMQVVEISNHKKIAFLRVFYENNKTTIIICKLNYSYEICTDIDKLKKVIKKGIEN